MCVLLLSRLSSIHCAPDALSLLSAPVERRDTERREEEEEEGVGGGAGRREVVPKPWSIEPWEVIDGVGPHLKTQFHTAVI